MKDNYECKICNRVFSSDKGLGYHITHAHKLSTEEYYLAYEANNIDNVGKCKVCGKPTLFINRVQGYQPTCSMSCGGKYGAITGKQTMLVKYGVKSRNNIEKNKQYYIEHPEAKKVAYERMADTKRKNNTGKDAGKKAGNKKQKYIQEFEQNNDCTMVYTLVRRFGQG